MMHRLLKPHSLTSILGINIMYTIMYSREMAGTKPLDLGAFVHSSPLGKLHIVHRLKLEERERTATSSQFKRLAIQSALEMKPEDRTKSGIRLIATVPLDQQGQLICAETLVYPIHTTFPYGAGWRFLSISNLALGDVYGDNGGTISPAVLQQVNQLVIANAGLVQENPYERYNRLSQQVKMVDSLIKEQKELAGRQEKHPVNRRPSLTDSVAMTPTTDRMEGLNGQKRDQILEYLQASQKLMEDYPHIDSLYRLSLEPTMDSMHPTLQMWLLRTEPLLRRLFDPTRPVSITRSPSSVATRINLRVISQARERVLAGTSRNGDHSYYQIARILGL